jgi:RNA polymerase-interacting CarD/CdnL/TRCF family regulator
MFKPGDMVVHVRHGAGVVLETRTLVYEGEKREYFCIEMNGDRRTLMIPVENVDDEELRPAITDIEIIEEVFNKEPVELDENYRIRQTEIRQQIKSRNPLKLAQALRDLVYLERTHKLTTTDLRLRDQVMQALARELALQPTLSVANARQNIQALIELAMTDHLSNLDVTALTS